ncbi:hypothetical protein Peur_006652 [Populus x canadensis]
MDSAFLFNIHQLKCYFSLRKGSSAIGIRSLVTVFFRIFANLSSTRIPDGGSKNQHCHTRFKKLLHLSRKSPRRNKIPLKKSNEDENKESSNKRVLKSSNKND